MDSTQLGIVRLGEYQLLEPLGRGGMGVVYRARNRQTHAPAAIKTLPAAFSPDPQALRRFLQEGEALARLDHPNIVRAFTPIQEEQGVYYFAMELVSGRSLAHLLHDFTALRTHTALEIARQVLDALAYAHGQGIVHRDIKPSNILFRFGPRLPGEPPFRAKVADFGLARIADITRVTVSGQILGTPEYMSPEQAEGRTTDPRTDLYSLGICLYEMLVGRVPFRAESPLAVLRQHSEAVPELPEALRCAFPAGLEAAVLRALAKAPADRFASAAEMRAALAAVHTEADANDPILQLAESAARESAAFPPTVQDAVAGAAPTHAPPPAGADAVAARPRRRRWPLTLGALLFLLVVGGAGFVLLAVGGKATTDPSGSPTPAVVAQTLPRVRCVQANGAGNTGELVDHGYGWVQLREPGSGRTRIIRDVRRIVFEGGK